MASNSYWQLEREYYAVAPDHDLIVRVIEQQKVTRVEGEGASARQVTDLVDKKVHEFKVKREVLMNACDYFNTLLNPRSAFAEGQQSTIDILESSAAGLTVWFKILHADEVASTTSTFDIRGLWAVFAAADKYGLDCTSAGAKAWFQAWYTARQAKGKFDFKNYQMLLFPCHTFDHAVGFAAATKYLSYNATGHITEKRPEGFAMQNLRLDAVIIQQINAAKGRLKTILHRGLYKPIDKLLRHVKCPCKAETLYAYEKALSNTGAWPLELTSLKHSLNDLLHLLRKFSMPAGLEMCHNCQFHFEAVVENAISETKNYFDGLCLDCMNDSNPKLSDADEDYWNHAQPGMQWDHKCRINHAQPSWYFSFMGRREKMIQWTKHKAGGRDGY